MSSTWCLPNLREPVGKHDVDSVKRGDRNGTWLPILCMHSQSVDAEVRVRDVLETETLFACWLGLANLDCASHNLDVEMYLVVFYCTLGIRVLDKDNHAIARSHPKCGPSAFTNTATFIADTCWVEGNVELGRDGVQGPHKAFVEVAGDDTQWLGVLQAETFTKSSISRETSTLGRAR